MNSNSDEYRQILSNQFEILALLYKLGGDDYTSKEYEVARDGIISGYGNWAFAEIPGSEELSPLMEERDKQYVLDVLGMYSFIYNQYNNLSEEEKSKVSVADLRFIGFDGNEDNGQYSFCNYLMEDLHRFTNVLDFIRTHSWETNSHGMGEFQLKKMLTFYKGVTDSQDRIEIKTAEDLNKFIE